MSQNNIGFKGGVKLNESFRERKVLDDLVSGIPVIVNGKKFEFEDVFSRNLLQHIRSLSDKLIEPPIGQDKALDLIDASKKVLGFEEVFSPPKEKEKPQSGSHRMLKIKRLSAFNFRGLQNFNSDKFTFDFKSEPYLLTGVNGTGKTSVLNAIVWCLTGHLLWDRTVPSAPQKVDLKTIDGLGEPRVIKNNWPIQVSIPPLESIDTAKPHCWVELELINDDEHTPVVVRREYNTNKESVTGMDSIDPLSIELALLMPGRVNHIQLTNDTQIGNLFFQISGLNALNKYGTFTSNSGIGRPLTTQINRLQQESQNLKQQLISETSVFNENLPPDMKETYEQVAVSDDNPVNRAASKIDWLRRIEISRLNQLSTLLNISEELPDKELIDLGKNILVAHENLKSSSPSNWAEIKMLFKAIEEWNEEAELVWGTAQDSIKQNLQLAIDWYSKLKQTENLRLKIVASQLVGDTDYKLCPLCKKEIEHDHPLKGELASLNQVGEVALKSVGEILNSLIIQLEKSVPNSFNSIKATTVKEIFTKSYESNIGIFLKEDLESIRDIGYHTVNELLAFDKPFSNNQIQSDFKLALADEPAMLEQIEAFEKRFEEYNRKVLLVSWASKHLMKLTNDMEVALGYKNMAETTMLGKLTLAHNIASSAKPVQTCIAQLQKVLDLFQQKNEVDVKIEIALKTKEACANLSKLTELSNELLVQDLKKVETKLYETYKNLYGGEDLVLRKIIPASRGRNFSLSFWVGFKNMLVEAGGILNASRIRALLWSYVFSLAKVGKENPSGDWLDFMVIDEPLTSLDQEHQRNFAQVVFNSRDQKQIIVASHDLRWPIELQNISQTHYISANFVNCYGISLHRDAVRLSEWMGQLDVKWNRWIDDISDIETGRDYVAAAREWCEEELKDILVWASFPASARDTLGGLIRKLEHAYQKDPLYQMTQVSQLITKIRLIEVDMQNSHHGCAERRNIMQNEVRKVHKHMKSDIPDYIKDIRQTVYHRRGVLTIV